MKTRFPIFPFITAYSRALFFFIFLPASLGGCQTSVAFFGVDTLIDDAVQLVYQNKYQEALNLCEQVITAYPDNPLGYLGKAGIYHILMLNFRISLFDSQFDSVTTLAIEAGERAIKKYADDAKAYFVLGAAYGFRGLNRIRKSQWLGAFHDGLKGISNIKKAQRLDAELYDVYYALGLFYYWKSVKAKVLTFLKMMKDEREKGIQYLQLVAKKGRFSKDEAKFALIEIYYFEDRYEEALTECQSMQEKYANDPTWLYLAAKISDKLQNWEKAKQHFCRLLKFLKNSPYQSYGFLAECHYGIARCQYQLGDLPATRAELDSAYFFSESWNKKKEIEGPLLDFDKVLDQMNHLDKELDKLLTNE